MSKCKKCELDMICNQIATFRSKDGALLTCKEIKNAINRIGGKEVFLKEIAHHLFYYVVEKGFDKP